MEKPRHKRKMKQIESPEDREEGEGEMGDGWEDFTSDLLLKFLMSRNVPLDVVKDSHFRALLGSVAQLGQKSCLLLENPKLIQRSLWKFEYEMKQYAEIVIESWKKTGCTVMEYNLKGEGSLRDQNKIVLGFYCPKGFIFVDVDLPRQKVRDALQNFVTDSSPNPWKNVIKYCLHDACCESECRYQPVGLTQDDQIYGKNEIGCVRQQVLVLWRDICQNSKWVQSLIRKSDQIYDHIATANLNGENLYNSLKQKWFEQVVGRKPTTSFARLKMVMRVESELRAWLSKRTNEDRIRLDICSDIALIIVSDGFWSDGRELLQVLSPFFKIPSLMDTLVPSVGYLRPAIDKAAGMLKSFSVRESVKYRKIWKSFECWRDRIDSVHDLSDYLTPAYSLTQELLDSFELASLEETLYEIAKEDYEDEAKVLGPELEAYMIKSSNPFANLSVSECRANHPVTLWEKYGGGFPLLQNCAVKLLSQPACCLCEQVEKHVRKLQGVDNFTLRLNALMMEEFSKMENVYKPIRI